MNDVYIDVSNVRAFAVNLHTRMEEDFKHEITAIKELLTGSDDGGDVPMPMGNVDAEYYGRDIAEAQTENATVAVDWLDSLQTSLEALVNAALVTSENLEASDGDNASGINEYFRAPTAEHPNLFPGIAPDRTF